MPDKDAAPQPQKKGIGFVDWLVREVVPSWVSPNHITMVRILFSFLMLAAHLAGAGYGLLVILGLIAGFSDLLDGAVARRRGLTTDLGAFLDPLSDKIFFAILVVIVVMRGLIPLWLILLLLLTEVHTVLIPALAIIKRKRRGEPLFPAPKVQPNRWGKLKTGWVASAIGLTLIGSWAGWGWMVTFGVYNLWVGLAMGLLAEYYYLLAYRQGKFE